MLKLCSLAVLPVLGLSFCNTDVQTEEPPPFDQPAAQAMLLRNLQAQVAGDLAGTEADLFPRQSQTLAACAKSLLAVARPATMNVPDEGGAAQKTTITDVSLSNVHQQAKAWVAGYTASPASAFQGEVMFVWANGRWWIKCQM